MCDFIQRQLKEEGVEESSPFGKSAFIYPSIKKTIKQEPSASKGQNLSKSNLETGKQQTGQKLAASEKANAESKKNASLKRLKDESSEHKNMQTALDHKKAVAVDNKSQSVKSSLAKFNLRSARQYVPGAIDRKASLSPTGHNVNRIASPINDKTEQKEHDASRGSKSIQEKTKVQIRFEAAAQKSPIKNNHDDIVVFAGAKSLPKNKSMQPIVHLEKLPLHLVNENSPSSDASQQLSEQNAVKQERRSSTKVGVSLKPDPAKAMLAKVYASSEKYKLTKVIGLWCV